MPTARVTTPCVVLHPETGAPFALKLNDPFEVSDPIVREYRWAFAVDGERAVEQATAEPGQKRNR